MEVSEMDDLQTKIVDNMKFIKTELIVNQEYDRANAFPFLNLLIKEENAECEHEFINDKFNYNVDINDIKKENEDYKLDRICGDIDSFDEKPKIQVMLDYDEGSQDFKETEQAFIKHEECKIDEQLNKVKSNNTQKRNEGDVVPKFFCGDAEITFDSAKDNGQSSLANKQSLSALKLHDCDYCNFKTVRKSNLYKHVNNIHTRANVHNCQYCEFMTVQKSKLSSHINAKHTRETLHKCEFCDYSSLQKDILRRHINAKHTKKNVFKCDLCDYCAFLQYRLKAHINAKHTREIKYECEYCNFTTVHKSSLRIHLNGKHFTENRFKCEFCVYSTLRKSRLNMHIDIKHTRVT